MPRRPLARALKSSSGTPHAQSPALPSSNSLSPDVLELRRHWKWAAFSQFFFTFAPLFNMSDVTIADVEDDLTRSTGLILPRVMQRLLYTLSYDRKVNLDNWQTVLRKQYFKRDPEANPIGPEPSNTSGQESSPAPEIYDEPRIEETTDGEGDPDTAAVTPASDDIKRESTADVGVAEARPPQSPVAQHMPESSHASVRENSPAMEESKNWLDLPMLVKLDSMHLLTEWQFHNPQRVRTLMKDDDEGALWRIEPIGYDAKSNAYWLIGADRLWIQRAIPKPSHQKKRKRPAASEVDARQAKRVSHATNKKPITITINGGRTGSRSAVLQPSVSRGGGRAAKAQAKMKLDAQAKDLAEFQRQAAFSATSKGKAAAQPPPPRGTRLSTRLRGAIEQDEWQPVPDEWLEDQSSPTRAKERAVLKTGLESDDESALTSLSGDEETDMQQVEAEETDDKLDTEDNLDNRGIEIPTERPSDFIEWETIAITLHEWEHVAERFEKATHYTEKALFKVLTVDIVPVIVAELKEIVRQRQLEEALVHRKRSSRIALKESEKEEAELAAQRRAEEAEKMSRARRLEARQIREEADRIKRETAREQRRKEREQREAQSAEKAIDTGEDLNIDIVGDNVPTKTLRANGSQSYQHPQANGSTSGSVGGVRTPDWELDCEICFRRGVNQDDGQPMMSCGVCNKWQHINCHDNADYHAGRSKRNWIVEEFVCQRCRSRASGAPSQQYAKPKAQLIGHLHPSEHMPFVQPNASARGYTGGQGYTASTPGRQNGHPVYGAPTPASMAPQRPYQPHSAITFAHYQPDLEGFSNRQTYQRDQPAPPQGYPQHQHPHPQQYAPPQQPQLVPPPAHHNQPYYGNGGWPQQTYPAYNGNYMGHQVPNPEWQASPPTTDARAPPSHHYLQYPQNPLTGSTPYSLPR